MSKSLQKLHLGRIDIKKVNIFEDSILFPYGYFDNKFLEQYPIDNFLNKTIRVFETSEEREIAYKECENLAYTYIVEFKRKYEAEKNVSYPDRFYLLTLLPYYNTVINFTYARYLYVKKFIDLNKKENFVITTFNKTLPRSFLTKKEFFMNLWTNIDFQEWFASVIIEKLNFNNVIVNREKRGVNFYNFPFNNSLTPFWGSLKKFLKNKENILKFHRFFFFLTEQLVSTLSYNVKSFNNIYGVGPFLSLVYSIILNIKKKRVNNLSENIEHSSTKYFPEDFINILDEIISYTLPDSIEKNFTICIENTMKMNTFIPGKIRFDSTGFVDDEKSFKHACSLLKGEKLTFVQHGSNYCTTANSWAADSYEYRGDYFVNWGHVTPKQRSCQFIVLPSPKLSRLKDKHQFKESALILIGTNQRQTMDGIGAPDPSYSLDYLKSKEIFIKSLSNEVFENFLYRPWPTMHEGSSFDDEKYIKNLFPNVNILQGDLSKKMLKSRLIVLDHYGTAFYEALVSNTPVMMYFAYPEFTFTPQAQQMFKEFKRVGVLYENAKDAAEAINEKWDKVEAWWLSEEVQRARESFMNLFALAEKNWKWKWIKFLFKIN